MKQPKKYGCRNNFKHVLPRLKRANSQIKIGHLTTTSDLISHLDIMTTTLVPKPNVSLPLRGHCGVQSNEKGAKVIVPCHYPAIEVKLPSWGYIQPGAEEQLVHFGIRKLLQELLCCGIR